MQIGQCRLGYAAVTKDLTAKIITAKSYNSQDFFLFVLDDLGCSFVPCHPCLGIQVQQIASM